MKIHLNYLAGSLFVLILFVLTIKAEATNYYVDAANGNNNNNGTSTSTPWKTLSKINSFNFQPGDVISLKRGEVWRESLTLNSSSDGSAGNYIKVTAYGTGVKPQINGSDLVTGSWTDEGSNIWSITVSSTILYDEVTIGKNDTTHWGYLQGSSGACTQDYYWYQGGTTFYIYSVGNPSTYYQWIQYIKRGSLISKQYIWLDNLDFAYGGKSGGEDYNLRTNNAHYMKITDCWFRYSGKENLYFLSSYSLIRNCQFYESTVHGIYCGSYSPYIVKADTIENCVFWNNLYNNIDLMNVDQSNSNAGHHVIRYNQIRGRIGNYNTAVGEIPANISLIGEISGTSELVGCKIYGNILTNGLVAGILISKYDDSTYIYNNTFDGNHHPAIMRTNYSGENGHYWIENNTFTNNTSYGIKISASVDPGNWTIDYNLYYNNSNGIGYYENTSYTVLSDWQSATGFDTHSYLSDPNYTNQSGGIYTIEPPSDAIDNGAVLGSPYNRDILGITRPQGSGYDIGAYEYVGGGGNNPPNQPANPSPANGAIDQSVNTTVTWNCSDPDGDPLTYDVYFGTGNNPPLGSGNQTNTSYDPGQLDYNTTYYWRIVAKDNQGTSTAGPLWSFSTETSGGNGGDTTLVTVNIKAYLDGPYTDGAMSTELSNNSLIPSAQPYNTQPWNYAGNESVSTVPQNIVDWILIELRSGTSATTVVARRAAFIRYDGRAVDMNGQTKVSFQGIQSGPYYILIRHRNHLAVMSKNPVFLTDSSSLYDFTISENQAYGNQALKSFGNGKYGLYAADGNSNGNINNSDYAGVWKKQNGTLGYENGDFDLNGGVNIVDRNDKWKPNKGMSSQVP